jgi:hypothetical protein
MHTFQGGTSRASIEPNDNIILSSRIDRGKEPVEELGIFGTVLFQVNWNLPSITLSDVKVEFGDTIRGDIVG